jgi:hypothetical protein
MARRRHVARHRGGDAAIFLGLSLGSEPAPAITAGSPGCGGGGWQRMADAFKCPKCGKTSPKFTNCCGTPMKKNG